MLEEKQIKGLRKIYLQTIEKNKHHAVTKAGMMIAVNTIDLILQQKETFKENDILSLAD